MTLLKLQLICFVVQLACLVFQSVLLRKTQANVRKTSELISLTYGLPGPITTLSDISKFVHRGRVTEIGILRVRVRVPIWSKKAVAEELYKSAPAALRFEVESLSFWDHIFLWRLEVEK